MTVFTFVSQALRTGEPLPSVLPSSLLDRLLYYMGHHSGDGVRSTGKKLEREENSGDMGEKHTEWAGGEDDESVDDGAVISLEQIKTLDYMFYASGVVALNSIMQVRTFPLGLVCVAHSLSFGRFFFSWGFTLISYSSYLFLSRILMSSMRSSGSCVARYHSRGTKSSRTRLTESGRVGVWAFERFNYSNECREHSGGKWSNVLSCSIFSWLFLSWTTFKSMTICTYGCIC
jgi:hypothetical protein